jgi:hypothetical protein
MYGISSCRSSGTHRDPGVTDRNSGGLSEFTWYSRLAAWIGAAMLLVQSILGRQAGPITFLAVVLLGIGFLCFLIGLAVDGHVPGTRLLLGADPTETDSREAPAEMPARSNAPRRSDAAPEPDASLTMAAETTERGKPGTKVSASPRTAPIAAGPARRPKFRERAKKSESQRERRAESVPDSVYMPEPATGQAEPVVEASPVGVETELLTPTSVAVGAECPRCGSTLRVGQLSADCPICGRTHHAICWMENHFHCGAPDCAGHGSLEAPAE